MFNTLNLDEIITKPSAIDRQQESSDMTGVKNLQIKSSFAYENIAGVYILHFYFVFKGIVLKIWCRAHNAPLACLKRHRYLLHPPSDKRLKLALNFYCKNLVRNTVFHPFIVQYRSFYFVHSKTKNAAYNTWDPVLSFFFYFPILLKLYNHPNPISYFRFSKF